MGQRGPRAKPRNLKVVEGQRKDRVPDNEPTPPDAEPELDDPNVADEVRAVWDRTLAEIKAMGLAFRADQDSLRCYCEAVVQHRRASAVLARTGVLVKGQSDRGGWVRNPALQIQRDAAMQIKVFAHEFGLTPSARTQLGIDSEKGGPAGAERLLS